MFYHGKMPNAERLEVERLFREGRLRVVVATSAFGEGIDLPDVRNVVLYHLNFDFGEFNQQAGRAGRDGAPARIHLLYGERDRALNEYLIDLDAPPLRAAARDLPRAAQPRARAGSLRGDNAELAGHLGHRPRARPHDRRGVAHLRGFATRRGRRRRRGALRALPAGRAERWRWSATSGTPKAKRRARHSRSFSNLALSAPAMTLERIINRPIYPSRVELVR